MIKGIVKIWDKVWAWPIWSTIKWPFGILVLWFVIFLIWSMEINKNFDSELMGSAGKWICQVGESTSSVMHHLSFQKSEPVKNVK